MPASASKGKGLWRDSYSILLQSGIITENEHCKTRYGKIVRRLLGELVTHGEIKGDITTLEDFTAIAKLRKAEGGQERDPYPPNTGGEFQMTDPDQTLVSSAHLRKIAHWLVLVAGGIFGGAFVVGGAMSMLLNPMVFQVALSHFAATVGLPSAALASLCIVIFLESTTGPIEFEGFGFKFKGASGPIILWVICFLAIASAIKLLWPAG